MLQIELYRTYSCLHTSTAFDPKLPFSYLLPHDNFVLSKTSHASTQDQYQKLVHNISNSC